MRGGTSNAFGERVFGFPTVGSGDHEFEVLRKDLFESSVRAIFEAFVEFGNKIEFLLLGRHLIS